MITTAEKSVFLSLDNVEVWGCVATVGKRQEVGEGRWRVFPGVGKEGGEEGGRP